eukprot:CAMPEP_0118859816 /NCGR_PEP_ID=MMETSP1163-20130328/5903_1 /TAXON_ID=124430 /ORGANISM="Phaeomonas parva, Strain CCMP2877" /LENGTH=58 /DNA_ID=CAMNT_0006793451 /DNA_START=395 /DNA_END=568 /DNA_ORIENTATION=+
MLPPSSVPSWDTRLSRTSWMGAILFAYGCRGGLRGWQRCEGSEEGESDRIAYAPAFAP